MITKSCAQIQKADGLFAVLIMFGLGFFMRLALIPYGLWHDSMFEVNYTDIDYVVFSDASRHVVNGASPYQRDTYRYTPLLAWILLPCHWPSFAWLGGASFGKLIFVVCDMLCACLHLELLKIEAPELTLKQRLACCAVWIFNPITLTVSSRGNAESFVALPVLGALLFMLQGRMVLAGILYGFSIHLKLYPITYAPAFYLFLCSRSTKPLKPTSLLLRLMPSRDHFRFATFAALFLLWITWYFYQLYGWSFLHETYLYHFERQDIQHNFSPYFYPMGLAIANPFALRLLGLAAFLPQLVFTLLLAWRYHRQLSVCLFLTTFAFVAFNKVVTSQYFLWYIVLLPSSAAVLRGIGWRCATNLTVAWLAAQALWLGAAYLLEFRQQSQLRPLVWLCSVLFLIVNCYILRVCMCHTQMMRLSDKKKLN